MKLATLCYIRKNGKTLMLHRVKKENDMHEGKWNGLGGKIEEGETPEECIIREVKEECGLNAKNPLMKGVLSFPQFSKGEAWYVFLFVISEFDGELIESNEGNLEWIDDDKLFDLNLWEADKIFMKWLDKEAFFSGKFIYKEGVFIEHKFEIHK
ncbi:MAG: 8-oxo-dGTP diphosphatase [Lutibacter sp.]|nr:8-oxo-dGTP diphosphatase [Lutibacter sp.]